MTGAKAKGKRVVKQNLSDFYFKIALGLIACITIPFLCYAHAVYTWAHENKPKDYKYPEYKQLWMTAVGAGSFKFMQEIISFCVKPLYSYLVPVKNGDEQAWERKVKKLTANTVGLVYFSLSTAWGYHILRYSTWLPWYLGGQNPKASVVSCFEVVFIEMPPGTVCYILFTYGYHVQDFFTHILYENDNDWREMLLHHIAAIALYPGFVFGGLMGGGVLVAWLHDTADIVVNLCRICNGLNLKIPTSFFYFLMVASWFYTRLFLLPYFIYLGFTSLKFPEPVAHFQPLVYLEITFLMVMQLLHVFWFGLFLKMGYRLVMKGEQKDLVQTVESDDKESPEAKKTQ